MSLNILKVLQRHTLATDSPRAGTDAAGDFEITGGNTFIMTANSATDLQIAFDEPERFTAIPFFPNGKGYVKVVKAGGFKKVYFKHSAVSGGQIVFYTGHTNEPDTFDIEISVGQTVFVSDSLSNTINPTKEDGNLATLKNAMGDAGSNPTNVAGYTALYDLYWIFTYIGTIRSAGTDPHYSLLTTTPLGASATYTGTGFDLSTYGFAQIHALAYSDQSGTLYVEFSEDNTNWRLSVSASLTGGSPATITSRIYGRYARVRYVNGATAQTVFQLSWRFALA